MAAASLHRVVWAKATDAISNANIVRFIRPRFYTVGYWLNVKFTTISRITPNGGKLRVFPIEFPPTLDLRFKANPLTALRDTRHLFAKPLMSDNLGALIFREPQCRK